MILVEFCQFQSALNGSYKAKTHKFLTDRKVRQNNIQESQRGNAFENCTLSTVFKFGCTQISLKALSSQPFQASWELCEQTGCNRTPVTVPWVPLREGTPATLAKQPQCFRWCWGASLIFFVFLSPREVHKENHQSKKKKNSCPWFFRPQFWGPKWLRQFMGAWDFSVLSAGKPPCLGWIQEGFRGVFCRST